MILFPPAKINLGLRILRKRPDNYHDLSTIMLPVGWCDILEIVPGQHGTHTLSVDGATPECAVEDNLVFKAVRAIEKHLGRELPPLDIFLMKIIPFGAGLGGGSSDASYTLIGINELLKLELSPETLAGIAKGIGADCPFFVMNYYSKLPQLAEGIGEVLSPVEIPALKGLSIAIAKPRSAAIPTREAYAGVRPAELPEGESLLDAAKADTALWPESCLTNDFETSIFPNHSEIEEVKKHFYANGAVYAAMSGSGAAVFGLFTDTGAAAEAIAGLKDCEAYSGALPA